MSVAGCSNEYTSQYKKIKKILNSKLVIENQEIHDRISESFNNNKLNFITYLQSEECISCNLIKIKQMYQHPIFEKYNIGCILILSPETSVEQIKMTKELCSNQIKFIIDYDSDFVNDNYTIFQNPAYKTFMIDADNRIKWVGNPLESHKTLTLFINSIK